MPPLHPSPGGIRFLCDRHNPPSSHRWLTRSHGRHWTAVVMLVLAAACGSDGSNELAVSAADPTALATAEPTSPTPNPSQPGCPNSHGGVCLGPLDAGTYTTKSFAPAVTYTVPDGWTNLEDLSGNFLLEMPNDTRYLAIFQNVRAPAECEETWADGVGTSIDDIAGWLTNHPGLATTEPKPVTVGGLEGIYVDISLDPEWTVTCPYSDGLPIVPFIIGDGVSQVHHVILPGFEERLYLLDWNGKNVAIEVGPEGTSLEKYLNDVLPIIESLKFTN